MKCLEKRTIFNFWEYMSCEKCKHNLVDEEIVVAGNKIYIYNIKKCSKIEVNNNIFLGNKKARLFLKDCIVNQNDIIFLIVENFNLEENMEWIEKFLDECSDIHILNI